MSKTLKLKRRKGYRPLSYFEDKLILIKGSDLFLSDLELKDINHILRLPINSNFKRLIGRLNIFSRLFRLNSSIGTVLQNKNLLLISKGGIFLCDLMKRKYIKENVSIKGNPFYLLESKLRKSVLIGDYTFNILKKKCSIYERKSNGLWSILFSFQQGDVNHIHSIHEDLKNNCFYILTGDFGTASSIWKADLDFKNVYIISHHGQSTRACWMTQDENYLYYASDRQDEINYFYRLAKDFKSNPSPEALFPINGPSINFYKCNNSKFVFSTVVEPISIKKNSFFALWDTRLPPGVLSKNMFIYYGSPEKGFKVIHISKKDFLPPRLFQFGDIYFPTGLNKSNYLHFYEQASESNGTSTVALNLSNHDN